MRYVDHETSTGSGDSKVTWTVAVKEYESSAEYLADVTDAGREDSEDALTELINASMRGSTLQGGKAPVKAAISDGDAKGIKEAIKGHQDWAKEFVPYAGARGRIAGVTKTAAGDVGKALLKADPEQLKKLAEDLGIEL